MNPNIKRNIFWFIFVILFFPVTIKIISILPNNLNSLNQAIDANDIQKAIKIIKNDPDVMNRGGVGVSSPFSTAIYSCNADIAAIFIKYGFDTNQSIGRQKESPLMIAVCHNCVPIIRLLLKNGADTNAKNIAGATPLSKAIEYDSLQIVKLLVEKGANIHYHRVLETVVKYKRIKILNFFIKNGLEGDLDTLLKS